MRTKAITHNEYVDMKSVLFDRLNNKPTIKTLETAKKYVSNISRIIRRIEKTEIIHDNNIVQPFVSSKAYRDISFYFEGLRTIQIHLISEIDSKRWKHLGLDKSSIKELRSLYRKALKYKK